VCRAKDAKKTEGKSLLPSQPSRPSREINHLKWAKMGVSDENDEIFGLPRPCPAKTTVVLACRRRVGVEKAVLPACRRGGWAKRESFWAAAAASG
jgi:hypothetical protein